jgi:hypothetical protein
MNTPKLAVNTRTKALKDILNFLLAIIWFLAICLIGWQDRNINVFLVFVIYLIVMIVIPTKNLRVDGFLYKSIDSVYSPLILLTISLFIIGSGLFGAGYNLLTRTEHYVVLQSPAHIRTVNMSGMSIHVPFLEKVSTFAEHNEITITHLTAKTADGKAISAYVTIDLSLINGVESAKIAAQQFGNNRVHTAKMKEAVSNVIRDTVAKYTLETLPSNLIFEDLVGTEIGLSGLQVRWMGDVIITNIHRTSEVTQ